MPFVLSRTLHKHPIVHCDITILHNDLYLCSGLGLGVLTSPNKHKLYEQQQNKITEVYALPR